MHDNYPTETTAPFGEIYSKAKGIAAELGYVSTFTFMRRWRQLGYPWTRFGRDVWLLDAEISKFKFNNTQQPATEDNNAHT